MYIGGLCISSANLKFSCFKRDQRGREGSWVFLTNVILCYSPQVSIVLSKRLWIANKLSQSFFRKRINLNRFKEWTVYGCTFTYDFTGDFYYSFCNIELSFASVRVTSVFYKLMCWNKLSKSILGLISQALFSCLVHIHLCHFCRINHMTPRCHC